MISKEVAKRLNDQINLELTAEYIYLGMSAWCKSQDWEGFAAWFAHQAEEERSHGMKIFEYLLDQGEEVELKDIKASKANYKSLLEIMEKALKHEEKVTKSYHEFMAEVKKSGDYATEIFLTWFITEQVEEEATAGAIVNRLRRAGDNVSALIKIDNEVKKREGDH